MIPAPIAPLAVSLGDPAGIGPEVVAKCWDHRSAFNLPSFLAVGDAPIAFTPGSAMTFGQSFFRESVKACQIVGRRGILLSRHREHIPPELPPTVRHFDYAPFSRILPRCAALVHHGGVGTMSVRLNEP